jgi:poly-gamma-glutamate capsule biosynthesis protein CapA/YwtB (metallophosphatase superfamily)
MMSGSGSTIHAGKHSARLLTKTRILLKADASEAGEGWNDSQTAAALDTSIDTVARTRQQLVEEGLEAVLIRKHSPASARPRIFDGAAEAKLIALTRSLPARDGYGGRWCCSKTRSWSAASSPAPATTQSGGR